MPFKLMGDKYFGVEKFARSCCINNQQKRFFEKMGWL